MAEPRSFYVGETIDIRVRISKAGTKTPTDPDTVVLSSLLAGTTPVTPTVTDFTRQAEGDFLLTLDTVALDPATYRLVVRITGGDKVAIVADRFVLQTP